MNKNLYKFVVAQSREVCAHPAIGKLLYDYIADLLDDPLAGEVEDHLLDCHCCRHEYLKVLSLRGAPDVNKTIHDKAASATGNMKIFSAAAFKKGR